MHRLRPLRGLSPLLVLAASLAIGCASAPSPRPGAGAEAPRVIRAEPLYRFLRARALEGDGEYLEARKSYDLAVAADPSSADLRLEYSRFLRNLGMIDEALAQAEQAVRLAPADPAAHRYLGELVFRSSKDESAVAGRAVGEFEKGNLPGEGSPEELVAFAEALLAAGREKDSAAAFHRFFSLYGQAPDEIRLKAADAYSRAGEDASAEAIYREGLAKNPDDGRAAFYLSGVLEKQGKYDEAIAVLRPLSDARPENLLLRSQLGWLLFRARRWNEGIGVLEAILKADEKNRTAREYLAGGYSSAARFDDAERLYAALVAESPGDLEVLYQRAANFAAAGRFDEAEKGWEELESRASKEPGKASILRIAVFQRALIERNRRDLDGALRRLKPVVEAWPSGPAFNLALDILRTRGAWNEALALAARARDLDPESLDVQVREAQILALSGNRAKADEIACRWELAGGRQELAAASDLRQRLGEYREAAALSRRGEALFPDVEDFAFRTGANLERGGERAAAEAVFRDLLSRKPDHAGTLNYLGYMLADSGRKLDEAEKMIRRAVELDPANAAYIDSLGWVLFRKKKLDEAERWLTMAERMVPEDWSIHDHVGDLRAARGDMAAALRSWKLSLELSADATDAEAEKLDAIRRKIRAAERR